jgi:hypothetical protein
MTIILRSNVGGTGRMNVCDYYNNNNNIVVVVVVMMVK